MADQDMQDQISKKLSALIAFSLVKDIQKQSTADNLKILVRFGLTNTDIADILGTTKGTVEVLKSRLKASR